MWDTGLKANLHEDSPAFPSQVLEHISMCRAIPAGRTPPQKQDSAHSHWDSPALPNLPAPSQFAAGKQGPAPVPRIPQDLSRVGEQLGKLRYNLQTYK